jgi:hypothetical protein
MADGNGPDSELAYKPIFEFETGNLLIPKHLLDGDVQVLREIIIRDEVMMSTLMERNDEIHAAVLDESGEALRIMCFIGKETQNDFTSHANEQGEEGGDEALEKRIAIEKSNNLLYMANSHYPEILAPTSAIPLMYAPVKIEGRTVLANIDSGCQTTLISDTAAQRFVQLVVSYFGNNFPSPFISSHFIAFFLPPFPFRLNLMSIVDPRVRGSLSGIGQNQCEIIGKIHLCEIAFKCGENEVALATSVLVVNELQIHELIIG